MAAEALSRAFAQASLAILLSLALSASAGAAPADLDRSFGNRGVAVVAGPGGAGLRTQAPAEMALGRKGEIFVLYANATPCPGFSDCPIEWSVARFSADGVRDERFGTGPGSALSVRGNEYEPADLAVGGDRRAGRRQGRRRGRRLGTGAHHPLPAEW